MRLLGLPSRIVQISDGPKGTYQTLQAMQGIIRQFRKNPIIRELSARIVQSLNGKDWEGEINALFNFVRNNIRYLQDINEVELLQEPIATLMLRHGDCDDMVMLLSSMLESIGYATKSIAIGFQPNCYEHVYLAVFIPDANIWVPLDPTEQNEMGWQATGEACRVELQN